MKSSGALAALPPTGPGRSSGKHDFMHRRGKRAGAKLSGKGTETQKISKGEVFAFLFFCGQIKIFH